MPTTQQIDVATWYREQVPVHEGLASNVSATLINLLKAKRIDYLAVSSRVKALDSVIGKMARKEYESPQEITDLCGIRVITYIESDIEKIAAIVSNAFKVDTVRSVDKSDELRADRFGYRSVHFICELGDTRVALPELEGYKGCKFEIQIRTVLQHAWAEIEHDRSYKFSGDLPTPIRRRLNLLAGMLEMADREFSTLANDIDLYARQIHKTAQAGTLSTAEITSISVNEYLKSRTDLQGLNTGKKSAALLLDTAVGEWKAYGLRTIKDLGDLLSTELVSKLKLEAPPTTYVGLARRAMMYSDLDRYFSKVFRRQWGGLRRDTFDFLAGKYGGAKVNQVLTTNGLRPVLADEAAAKPVKKTKRRSTSRPK